MRFAVPIKADTNSEAGRMPSRELLAAMGRSDEALSKAGKLLAGEGLHPTSKGALVLFSGGTRMERPFANGGDLIAGFRILQVASLDQAIKWVERCPSPMEGDAQIEIRRVFDAEDFGAEFTPELREQGERRRAASAPS